MMTLQQFYLTKIAEEAAEVAKIALKAQQFGLTEVQPGREESNAERMYAELNDLNAMVLELNRVGFGQFYYQADHAAMSVKMQKCEKYLGYSRSLGLVEQPQPVSLEYIEGMMESMNMELAVETSLREEVTFNGHTAVVEQRYDSQERRYGQWIIDGLEMDYYKAVVALMKPKVSHTEQVAA
jgi:hypothetical protein